MDMEFSIKARDNHTVFVNPYDDGVWMSIYGRDGSYRVILTTEQAKQIIEAMQAVIEAAEAK